MDMIVDSLKSVVELFTTPFMLPFGIGIAAYLIMALIKTLSRKRGF